jgi:predicted acylesterase/phospholipase RssA
MMSSNSTPTLECDIVMAGGITSGVAFPPAILELKDKYRFRGIGGTSAGAIAAAIAAAAEYGRREGGPSAKAFETVNQIPKDLQENLSSLFQPVPSLRRLFAFLNSLSGMARPEGGAGLLQMTATFLRVLGNAMAAYWALALVGLALWGAVFLPMVFAYLSSNGFGLPPLLSSLASIISLIAVVFFFVLSVAGVIAIGILRDVMRLEGNDFGICPGISQNGSPGVVDWIDARLQEASGLSGRPLTFGDLKGTESQKEVSIALRMMTSNLTLGTGETLPMLDGQEYFFDPKEMRLILPAYVVDHMEEGAETKKIEDGRTVCRLPLGDNMPVILAVRMSLNFPVLFTAAPFYFEHRFAVGSADKADKWHSRHVRLLFSDGGITSNFPIRYFDSIFPSRPTFGVSLEDVPEYGKDHPRVYLPMPASAGKLSQPRTVKGLVGFVFAIVNAARQWQDRKLGKMAGYRERIGQIFLKPGEGGLNLAMPAGLVKEIGGYGVRAGKLFNAAAQAGDHHDFDFDDHQWRRFLIAYARIEALLEEANSSWKGGQGRPSVRDAIAGTMKDPVSYAHSSKQWRSFVFERTQALVRHYEDVHANPTDKKFGPKGRLRDAKGSDIPAHNAKLKIVPDD